MSVAETERQTARLGSEPKRVVTVEGGGPARHLLAGDIMAPENTAPLAALIVEFLQNEVPRP